MTNYRKVEVICQKCKAPFLVTSTVVWHTRLCPVCRIEVTRKQQQERNKMRYRHTCIDCQNVFSTGRKEIARCRPCHLKYIKALPRLSGHQYMNPYGYIFISVPEHQKIYHPEKKNYFTAEHRYVVEKALKRPLSSSEIVHHLNGIKHDNRLSNLAVANRRNHHWDTVLKLAQKRIRDLEAQLSQQRLC